MKSSSRWILPSVLVLLTLAACRQAGDTDKGGSAGVATAVADGPAWARDANIYEVNIRQFTPEGTFAAFEQHLPRLKKMGVDILWFMPVFPISEARRKGALGSYYAVADYTGINPNFGTMEEFKMLVHRIHDMGMRVVLDWVPNHTGWDHPWIEEHPEWYTRDGQGNITDPVNPETGESFGWTDVADLDYSQPGLRRAMTEFTDFPVFSLADQEARNRLQVRTRAELGPKTVLFFIPRKVRTEWVATRRFDATAEGG